MRLPTRNFMSSLSLATVLSFLTPPANAAAPADYWRETNLGISHIKGAVFNVNCYAGNKNFLGCIAALKELADAANPKSTVILASQTEKAKDCRTIETFGPVVWCEKIKEEAPPQLKPSEFIAQAKAKLKANDAAYLAVLGSIKNSFESCMAFSKQPNPQFCFARIPMIDFDSAVDHMWAEVNRNQPSSLAFAAGLTLNAFMNTFFDPHTDFRPAKLMNEKLSASSSFVGVGIIIQQSGDQILIAGLVEGGPALAAGLRRGDIITKIDGNPVESSASIETVTSRLQGTEGSQVRVQVLRAAKPMEFTVVRKKIVTKNLTADVVEERGRKIGYLRLRSFSKDSCAKIKEGLQSLKARNVEGLIFDLRGNGGGLLDQAVCIGGLFVGQKVIVKVQNLGETTSKPMVSTEKQLTDLPMVTLIDAGSASASELVSGALQDHKRSWIAGDRTFGKGSVQVMLPVAEFFVFPWMRQIFKSDAAQHEAAGDNETLLFAKTIQIFLQPTGRTNQSAGITPDFALDPFPGATDDEKFALREENMYTNALDAQGAPWIQPRPEAVSAISGCLKSSGQADSLFAEHKDDPIPRDYQILKAQDILACTNH